MAICRSISASASATSSRTSASLRSVMTAASAGRKPSSVVSSSTCRRSGGQGGQPLAGHALARRSGGVPGRLDLEPLLQAVEQPVEPDLDPRAAVEDRRIGQDRLEARGHMRVAAGLGGGQCPRVAAQVGQVGSDFL